ncbi:hypothetical protein HAX54_005187, partial [Datura stramonium]|nr:hypothetical protein [Datura stramonium]
MGCKRFPKKVAKIGNKFHCKKCERVHHSVAHRYKLQVRLMDGTGFISLLLWDRVSNTKYFTAHRKTPDVVDDGAYLLELETILDKMTLFKVVVKRRNVEVHDEVYIVIKISDDEDFIKQFLHSPNEDTFTIYYV